MNNKNSNEVLNGYFENESWFEDYNNTLEQMGIVDEDNVKDVNKSQNNKYSIPGEVVPGIIIRQGRSYEYCR